VAECVEDQRTLDTLKALGVDYVQGFLIGKPMERLHDIFRSPADSPRELQRKP
jgi:EAL domain-containing protein (putative c-di-GMP-specific phosphodiesterase class I)